MQIEFQTLPVKAYDTVDGQDVNVVDLGLIRSTVRTLFRRGGSHTGDLQSERHRGGHCPRDGAVLLRRTVGGRTTYSCPAHQR